MDSGSLYEERTAQPASASDRADPGPRLPGPTAARPTPGLRICLAASGGGHVRQLLDLERLWSAHEHFFVTEDTPLTRSIAEKHTVRFVPHFALGQIRHGTPFRMLAAGCRSFVESALMMGRERPDVVVTTGAGTVFFPVLWARLFGAKVILVETFARFDGPSIFGKYSAPLASLKVVQSSGLRSTWPDAVVFDPLRLTGGSAPEKQPLLFATVGATLPFDRLVRMVADLKLAGEIPERVVIQTGAGGTAPEGIETHESLSFDEMQTRLSDADIVICHAGTGSLITALRAGCRIIAVPRERSRKEVYDDHQFEIAQSFAARGLIDVARDKGELAAALKRARSRPRVTATFDHTQLNEFLQGKLAEWASERLSTGTS